jgi:hypothetical protein
MAEKFKMVVEENVQTYSLVKKFFGFDTDLKPSVVEKDHFRAKLFSAKRTKFPYSRSKRSE